MLLFKSSNCLQEKKKLLTKYCITSISFECQDSLLSTLSQVPFSHLSILAIFIQHLLNYIPRHFFLSSFLNAPPFHHFSINSTLHFFTHIGPIILSIRQRAYCTLLHQNLKNCPINRIQKGLTYFL